MNTSVFAKEPIRVRDRDDAFSATEFWRLIVDDVWLVIAIVVLVTGASTLYAYLATPSFAADALIKVDFPNPDALGVASQGQQQANLPTLPTDAEIQIIQSRNVLLPVISKFHLDVSITPDQVPLFSRVTNRFATPGNLMPPILGLKSYAWGGEDVSVESLVVPSRLEDTPLSLRTLPGGRYQLLDPDGRTLVEGTVGQLAHANGISILVDRLVARPSTEFTVVRYSEFIAMERFLKKIKVMESGKDSGVVQIVYENNDPELAQLVTNAIAHTYVASHIAQLREEASTTREFINSELPKLRANLTQAESALNEYRTTAKSMQPNAEASSYLQGSIDLARQIAILNTQKAQLASLFAPGTRQMQTIDQQLDVLNNAKQAFDTRFNELPTSDRKTADLTRDAKVAEEIYVAMLNKSSELAVTRAGTLGNVHIIDTALLPTVPVKPKRLLVIAAGVAAGMILSVLFVFVRNQLSRSVGSPKFVERHLSLPVFGAVLFSVEQARLDRAQNPPSLILPKGRNLSEEQHARSTENAVRSPCGLPYADPLEHSASRTGQQAPRFLLSANGHNDMAIDTLRAVRASLQIDIANAENNVLVIAGATPGTGKSFVASNLAVLHAQAGRRVLLIDGDLRRGRLAAMFGQSNAGGLAEVLAGRIEANRVIRSGGVSGLSIIAAGAPPANPAELLSTLRLPELLEGLRQQYDLVIVDTPAVLAVSDANFIASHASSTVLVVRPSAQSEGELEETVKRLDRTGARVIGVIFNAMPRRRSEKRTYAYASNYAADVMPRHAGL